MSIIDQVLENYKPEAETYTIELPKGETFTFRHFQSADDFDSFTELTAKHLDLLENPAKLHPEMKKVFPKKRKTVAQALMISYLAIEPKITELDAFKLAANAPVFLLFVNRIESERARFVADEVEASVEEAKKD